MATAPEEKRDLSPIIRELFESLRTRIRIYVWLEGVAVLLAFLGAAFWLSLGIDWFLSQQGGLGLPRGVRMFLITAALLALGWLAFRYILRRAFVQFSERNLAVLLERRFREFRDSLVTSVELRDEGRKGTFNSQMLQATYDDAVARAKSVTVSDVFNATPLWRTGTAAVILTASVIVFGLAARDAFGIYIDRFVRLQDTAWPRPVRLEVAGFPTDDVPVVKVARGGNYDLVVRAYLNRDQYPVEKFPTLTFPRTVAINYSTADGDSGRVLMAARVAAPGAEFQEYEYRFQGILGSVDFDVRARAVTLSGAGSSARYEDFGGSAVLRGYRIEMVESPKLNEMVLACNYPEYQQRSPAELPASGVMSLPYGTHITLKAISSKPLVRAMLVIERDNSSEQHEILPAADKRTLAVNLDELGALNNRPAGLRDNLTLLFTLYDEDGIHNREPVRLALSAVPDEIPQVAVRPKGISSAITPRAIIPVKGEIVDDWGVTRTWFDLAVDEEPSQELDFTDPPKLRDKLQVQEAVDLRELQQLPGSEKPAAGALAIKELKPGQKLALTIRARDAYDLGDTPNVGSSERLVLDVVTDDQLRAMLEIREFNLRQRFQKIIEEMTDNRNSLARLSPAVEAERLKQPETPENPADPGAEPPAPKPEDDPDGGLSQFDRRSLRLQRGLQNSAKNADETLALATAFEDMVEELTNNRIDSLELKSRLQEEIAGKLKLIGEQMFPELDKRLKTVGNDLKDDGALEKDLNLALRQADAILVEMESILARMKEMEDFNELLAELRRLINDQDSLIEATKQKQIQALKLLED